MAQLQANGLQIEYDTFGQASDDPVLLIMGLGTQMTAWSPEFCGALAAHGHFVIRFDNRDTGLSTKFDGVKAPGLMHYAMNHFLGMSLKAPYSLSEMASDAVGVLDALDIPEAHIVGASMGGMIAQLTALKYPERAKSLTSLMSTSGDPGLPRPRRDVMRQIFMNRSSVHDPDAMLAHLLKSARMISSPGFPRSDDDWREQLIASVQRSFYPQGFARQLAAIVDDGSRVQRLKSVNVPALVIHGNADPLVPVECGIDTAKHLPNATLEIIEGMGHDLPPQLIERLTSLIAGHAQHVRGN